MQEDSSLAYLCSTLQGLNKFGDNAHYVCITIGLAVVGLTVDGHDNWCSNTAVLMFAALCPRSRCMSIVSSSSNNCILMVSVKTGVIPETHYSDYIVHIIESMIR